MAVTQSRILWESRVMKNCLVWTFLFVLMFVVGTDCRSVRAEDADSLKRAKPNILFIFSDDHAYQAISAYDSKINKTPNIDRIAKEGIRFDRCCVTNSICGPARAVILTGKYSHLNGFRQNGDKFDGTQQTFPKLLRKAGYQTAIVGKWHLNSDPIGFDHWFVLPGQGQYYNPDFLTPDGRKRVTGYVTDVITDNGLDWLKNGRDPDKPFMLMLQHKAPHRAWLPSPKHLNMYDNVEIPEPATLLDDYDGRAGVLKENQMEVGSHMRPGPDLKLFDESKSDSQPFKRFFNRFTEKQKTDWLDAYRNETEAFLKANPQGEERIRWQYQRYIKDYLRCIASVDDNVGRVLDYLDDAGLAENTVVIYSSDQGFYLGEHGWYDKRWIFEESLRAPLVVRWPGVTKPGTSCAKIVSNLDFAETFLDLAGQEIPDDMQGASLVPILKGSEPDNWRNEFYYHYYELGTHNVAAHYGLVTDQHKLIHYYKKVDRANGNKRVDIDQWDLMDRKKDPLEMHSYIDDPAYQSIQTNLKQRLVEIRKKLKVNE